jgi:hypothetical protein
VTPELDKTLEQFQEQGYVVLEQFITPELAAELNAIVLGLAEHERKVGKAHLYGALYGCEPALLQRVWGLVMKAHCFRELIDQEILFELMERIFDRDTPHQKAFISSFQANIVRPGGAAQNIHIDTPVPNPLPQWEMKANTIWALNDFTELNGATGIVPKSHRLRFKPDKRIFEHPEEVQILLKAGDLLVTSGYLWHRSHANRSMQPRVALLGSFAASFAREIATEENYSLIMSEAQKASLSNRLRAMLGISHGLKFNSF